MLESEFMTAGHCQVIDSTDAIVLSLLFCLLQEMQKIGKA